MGTHINFLRDYLHLFSLEPQLQAGGMCLDGDDDDGDDDDNNET